MNPFDSPKNQTTGFDHHLLESVCKVCNSHSMPASYKNI